jgi:hypothetical protein
MRTFNRTSCTYVHPDAITMAKQRGYDSIQIVSHIYDTMNVTVLDTPEETAKHNSKFEIIDLTSGAIANWVGLKELPPNYRNANTGGPCYAVSRKIGLGAEPEWFSWRWRLLHCVGPPDQDSAESGDAAVPAEQEPESRCSKFKTSMKVQYYWDQGWSCRIAGIKLSNWGHKCNPFDPEQFSNMSCSINLPDLRPFRGGGTRCDGLSGVPEYPPRWPIPRFGNCAVVPADHSLLRDSECGSEIDAHEGVFRLHGVGPVAGPEQEDEEPE